MVMPEQAKLLDEFLGPKQLGELAGGRPESSSASPKASSAPRPPPRRTRARPPGWSGWAPSSTTSCRRWAGEGRRHPRRRAGRADGAVPRGRRPDLLHPRAIGPERLKKLAESTDRLGFISEFGAKAYNELDGQKAFEPLLENLRDLDPEAAHALVDKVRAARGPRAKLEAAGEEPPEIRPRRATGRVGPDKKDTASWDRNLKRAKDFATDHDGRPDRAGKPYKPSDEQIEMLATMYQLRENAPMNRKLPHDKRVQMLDEFDQLGREAGLETQWINNLRGGLSESLFSPGGGTNKTRLPHPDGGFTILDYVYEPGARPGTKTGGKEWVEQKSDLITAPAGSEKVFAPAVGRARRYVTDAALDMKAVAPGETILIDFVRRPGNAATETAMLDVLFAEGSPIQAVKFANGGWISARTTWPTANPRIRDGWRVRNGREGQTMSSMDGRTPQIAAEGDFSRERRRRALSLIAARLRSEPDDGRRCFPSKRWWRRSAGRRDRPGRPDDPARLDRRDGRPPPRTSSTAPSGRPRRVRGALAGHRRRAPPRRGAAADRRLPDRRAALRQDGHHRVSVARALGRQDDRRERAARADAGRRGPRAAAPRPAAQAARAAVLRARAAAPGHARPHQADDEWRYAQLASSWRPGASGPATRAST